jgi:hypothetical protein
MENWSLRSACTADRPNAVIPVVGEPGEQCRRSSPADSLVVIDLLAAVIRLRDLRLYLLLAPDTNAKSAENICVDDSGIDSAAPEGDEPY